MSTALYRRYRPETFADVIGQEHVTDPLMAAIDKDRINHAYLFSGPRGCGKTTSARILARCLNCAQGPTSTPCGVCDSCVGLARNGSGSLDVIEIDAASHGGVDDARDLRERATFAPVRDRYKIFIIDEAHMVTSAGFNALLKIVEEPPEHILFIFATTEPDKVIGTIRSRTHHYPFRLVPPEPLMAYLDLLCRQENVPVAPGVLSLVVRAGGGSVRDCLSVLDQLMAGAGENGLDYELAVSLLGYTHASLLDDVVDSMAAGDAGTVFHAVDRVIQTGHDPRRFVEDLLERFRDLIVINAVPEGAASILRGVPDDQLNRMRTQANQLGAGELSRAADVTNTALTEMTGATSPRLHLELLCARLLLPAADATVRGTLARVDRIERRLEYAGGAPVAEPLEPGADPVVEPAAEAAARPPERSRLEGVPRNAEEAAAQWSLPSAAPAEPDPHAPAVPAAARNSSPATTDASADWGASWGVSTEAGFSASADADRPSVAPLDPAQPGPSGTDRPAAAERTAGTDQPAASGETPIPDASGEAAESSDVDHAAATTAPAPAAPSGTEQQAGSPAHQNTASEASHSQNTAAHQDTASEATPAREGSTASENIEMIRRAWPEIMTTLAGIKRATWLIVNVAAAPRSFDGNQLVLAFANQGNAIGFQRGAHMDNVKQAIHKVLGLSCSIEAVHDAGGAGGGDPKVPAGPPAPTSDQRRTPAASPSQRTDAPAATGPRQEQRTRPDANPAPDPGQRRQNDHDPVATAPGPGQDQQARPAAAAPESGQRHQEGRVLSRNARAPLPEQRTSRDRGPGNKAPDTPHQNGNAPREAAPDRASAGGRAREEAVSAWDPSTDDDSWALVEPPEDAFDPGAAWGSVPHDPSERSGGSGSDSRASDGASAPPTQAPPTRARPALEDPPSSSRGVPSQAAPDEPSRQERPDSAAENPAPAAQSSRSVVWSPPESSAPSTDADAASGRSAGMPLHAGGAPVGAGGWNGPAAPVRADVSAAGPGGAPSVHRQEPVAVRQKPVSRYQQLLDEGQRRRAEETAAGGNGVDPRFVEDEPSADDETLEESGLVGRAAIERILGGRLVEERTPDNL